MGKTSLMFDISPLGIITVESKGFKGPACEKILAKLKLGQITSDTKTREYYGGGPGEVHIANR